MVDVGIELTSKSHSCSQNKEIIFLNEGLPYFLFTLREYLRAHKDVQLHIHYFLHFIDFIHQFHNQIINFA